MTIQVREEDLLTLACTISERPANAPGLEALTPHLLCVDREDGAVTFTFGREGAALVEAFAAAEMRCCPSLGWRVTASTAGEAVELSVSGTPEQLAILSAMFGPGGVNS